ncbi:MAG TPA: citrate synthase [Anaerolineae bacterium]|nr:citrate synthase [Anaerolineae bacterium]HIP70622.1 citrate synthase [Anaerolineae bacterium]
MLKDTQVEHTPTNGSAKQPKPTLTVIDNRTGKTYEMPIYEDTIRAMDLRQIKVNESDFGMMSYDPGFKNTASTKSAITYIDGGAGILEYRGYPIAELAENSNFMEVAYLVLNGELPTEDEYNEWVDLIKHHTLIHENMRGLFEGFRYDAHPMGMLISNVAALATFYPEAKDIFNEENRRLQMARLIAKMPTLAAFSYRYSHGLPFNYPDNRLSYAGNFLNMMFKMVEPQYEPDPAIERALDILFILHADHEQNCGTHTMRSVGSSHVDPYTAVSAAASALYGPLHGGANEAVLRMLNEIGSMDNIPAYMERVKNREVRLMGFGHRVYKNYDPRARIIKQAAEDVFEVTGRNDLLDIALELERIALNDEYFISHKLYPNVDFYSGIIYKALGLPVSMFPVMFAIPRTVGWLAQWEELLLDKEQAIARPRQIYLGKRERHFVPIDER